MSRSFTWISWLIAMLALTAGFESQAQGDFVHPGEQPPDIKFEQPPVGWTWVGPSIRQVHTLCWHAEPSNPTKPIGGSNDWQQAMGFAPIQLPANARIDSSYRQGELSRLAGGGSTTALKPEEMPAGVFVSAIGHPIFKVTQVQYPAKNPIGFLTGVSGIEGGLVFADFMHLPNMGACHFYIAVWLATKSEPD